MYQTLLADPTCASDEELEREEQRLLELLPEMTEWGKAFSREAKRYAATGDEPNPRLSVRLHDLRLKLCTQRMQIHGDLLRLHDEGGKRGHRTLVNPFRPS
jgi:hypothetical protein